MSLDRLTIVIPTYCRQEFILRQIRFWSASLVKVVVLDGSPSSYDVDVKSYGGSNFHYHHSPVSIEQRLGQSVEFINTDYVALLSDDH